MSEHVQIIKKLVEMEKALSHLDRDHFEARDKLHLS
jgi:hypothetical protein